MSRRGVLTVSEADPHKELPSTDQVLSLLVDGLAPELAMHLLSLHWNRQHFAFMITYRPREYAQSC